MLEDKVKGENAGNPAIHGSIQLDVGIIKHAFDVLCVNFNCKVLDTYNPYFDCPECLKMAVQFKLCLRAVRLMIIPSDRSKSRWPVPTILVVLKYSQP